MVVVAVLTVFMRTMFMIGVFTIPMAMLMIRVFTVPRDHARGRHGSHPKLMQMRPPKPSRWTAHRPGILP